MLPILCTIFMISGAAFASPVANQFVDNIIYSTLQSQLRALQLEHAPLPAFHNEFKDHIKIIGNVKVLVDYFDGNLTGLLQVHRAGECSGPSHSLGESKINCTLVFDQLNIEFKAKMKYGKLPTVTVNAHSKTTSGILVFVDIVKPAQSPTASVRRFEIRQLAPLETNFTGLGKPLNKMLAMLDSGFNSQMNAEIPTVLARDFSNALNLAVMQVPFPNA